MDMTDHIEEETIEPSELDSVKQIADNMGIKYSPNIGVDKLKEKIAEKKGPKKEPVLLSKGAKYAAIKRDLTQLVRIRVANMDPNQKSWKGTWAMGANKATGTLKKFVPFNSDYHLEKLLFNILRDKKWRETYEVPDGKGGKIKKNRFVPCYNIEVLKPLTSKELQALADDQKKRQAIDAD